MPDGTISIVDRAAAVPLYHQIYVQLRDEIISGERVLGSRVPTEQELARLFSVSRITARRALDELADNGFVVRKRRVGTTVVYRNPVMPIEANINQAMASLVTFGRATDVSVVDITHAPAKPHVAALLGVEPGTMLASAIRIRSLDKPLSVQFEAAITG